MNKTTGSDTDSGGGGSGRTTHDTEGGRNSGDGDQRGQEREETGTAAEEVSCLTSDTMSVRSRCAAQLLGRTVVGFER